MMLSDGRIVAKGWRGFRRLWWNYKYGAKRRKPPVPFELTEKQFREITSDLCYLCGTLPSQKSTDSYDPKIVDPERHVYTYNGIDRVDSSKGYVTDNVQPCCKYCNSMKSDLDLLFFLAHIQKILNYQGVLDGVRDLRKAG